MFMSNDPWIGATHQSDVAVMAPVFHEGELFCWVGNTCTSGTWAAPRRAASTPSPRTSSGSPPCIPPVKIVEDGDIRVDVEESTCAARACPTWCGWTCAPRSPAAASPRNRIVEMIGRYGAGTVKATMRKLQDDSEAAFLRRLDTIPDGSGPRRAGWRSPCPATAASTRTASR